jgi:acyl-CoA synthetase (AMP-forming)/AMP-acid ligase II
MREEIQPGYSPLEVMLRRRVEEGSGSLIADGVEVRLDAIYAAAQAVAARLVIDGVEPGDHIVLVMRNSAEFLAASLGVMFAGAVLVPVNVRFTTAEMKDLLAVAAPRAWIADEDLASVVHDAEGEHPVDFRYPVDSDSARPLGAILEWAHDRRDAPIRRVRKDDIAAVFFTAGTTSRPKGAMTSHAALAAFVGVAASAMSISARDTVILPMPMFYTGGIKASLANLLTGARVVVFRSWSPPDLVDATDEYQGTFLWGVTSVWALLLKSNNFSEERVSSLRAVWRTGSFTPRALLNDLKRVWPDTPHYHSYGLTECNVSSMEQDAIRHPESCGFPTAGVEITIDGHVTPETVGEIWVRGPQQFSRYLNDDESTRRALDEGGWVHTEDQGWLEPSGRLHVLGRGSDMIIRGGENISAAEIERVILECPNVEEVAVVPVPDDVFGHELRAVVVPTRDGVVDADRIREGCSKMLAEFKVPKFIEIRLEPLPKNPSGKIAKSSL